MTYLVKPAWLTEPTKLSDIIQHQIFMPATIPKLTSLKEEQPFIAGIRQYLFWKGQLLPSVPKNTIFLAFLGPEGLKPPNILNVTKALKEVCDLFQVCEFYQGANTCFLALSFKSIEPINHIISRFKYFNNSVVLSFTHQSTQQHRFRLLWLPPLFDINRVHHLLSKYTASHRLRRESIPFADNIYSPTNVLSGTLTVKPGVDITSLPHLIQLPAPHRGCALLSIEARPPLCLKCHAVGHTRPHCQMSRCPHCDKVHFPTSPCGLSSYSSVAARNITPCSDDDWLTGLSDTQHSSDPSITSDDSSPSHHLTTLLPNPDTHPEPANIPHDDIPLDMPTSMLDDATECDRTHDSSTDVITTTASSQPNLSLAAHSVSTHQPPSIAHNTHKHNSDHTSASNDLPNVDAPLISSKIVANSSIPIASFSKSKASSKVHILDHYPPPSTIARSHLITYSTADKGALTSSSHLYQSTTSSAHSAIFGDPEGDNYFSSDVDLSSEPGDPQPPQDMHCEDSISRKRKVSRSSSHSPPDTPVAAFPSDALPYNSPSIAASSTPISRESLDELIQPDTAINIGPSPELISFRQRVAAIFSADMDQVCLLEQLCPNGTFTNDIIKTFKLFFEHGIFITHILDSPFVLKLGFPEIKKKIGYLKKHLSIITIGDICQQRRLEDKLLAGESLTPSLFFH